MFISSCTIKSTLLFMIALGTLNQIYAVVEREKDTIERVMISNHTRVFSKDNLVLSRLPADDLRVWDKAVGNVQQFVKNNASALTNDSNDLAAVSNELIALLVVLYNQYIAPAFKNPADRKEGLSSINPAKIELSKINVASLEEAVYPLELTKNRLIELQKKLEKQLKTWRDSLFTPRIKGDAVELLLSLELILETTVIKVINDIKKIVAAAESKAEKVITMQR
jgi:hypothetical protein